MILIEPARVWPKPPPDRPYQELKAQDDQQASANGQCVIPATALLGSEGFMFLRIRTIKVL
jgi:hypothetical protein